MRNKHYPVRQFRLDDEVTAELKRRKVNFESWNLLFKDLLYGTGNLRRTTLPTLRDSGNSSTRKGKEKVGD